MDSSFPRGKYKTNDASEKKSEDGLLREVLLLPQMCLTTISFHRPLGTTFKGKYGCVDYWVKAFLERPSFPTQEIKKRFEVMDPVDVNTPELLVSAALLQEVWVSAGS